MARAIPENTLLYGDNLAILRDASIDKCVDLISLDPPFHSHHNDHVLFQDEHGSERKEPVERQPIDLFSTDSYLPIPRAVYTRIEL